jgi:hypothetical protein
MSKIKYPNVEEEYDEWWPPQQDKQKEMQRQRLVVKYARACIRLCHCIRTNCSYRRGHMWHLVLRRLDRKLDKLCRGYYMKYE